jgi:flagellar hook-associated protein 3 FlgL
MDATRLSMLKMQARLADAQKELGSGRLADVGKSLGQKAGQTVSLREEHSRLSTMIDTNTEVTTRLKMTQDAMKHVLDGAQKFISQIIGSRDSTTAQSVVKTQAQNGLSDLVGTLNMSQNGVYIFSGINTDVKPLADYFEDPSAPNRQAVQAAFTAAFGPAPDLQTITPAAMQAFLDGPFTDLFNDTNWKSDWSSASDQNLRSRISTKELAETSTNANETAFRKLAMVYTMMSDLGAEGLNSDTYKVLANKAIAIGDAAVTETVKLQGTMGIVEERTTRASENLSLQIDIITTHIGALESVDPYEAETRVTALLTQIEISYSLTSRIQKLSLLNYL